MGRTNPTYRDFLADYEGRWQDFRRALRYEAGRDFDRLFERARRHADAAGYANAPDRDLLVAVSMLLAHETELRRLRERLATVEAAVDGPAGETAAGESAGDTAAGEVTRDTAAGGPASDATAEKAASDTADEDATGDAADEVPPADTAAEDAPADQPSR